MIFRNAIRTLSLLVFCFQTVFAASLRPEPVGVRALGMGGAFSAVAADASAVYWNPGALASLQRQELGAALADRFDLGLKHQYLNYVLPVGDNHAIGFDWFNLGFDDSELDADQNRLSFAYSYRNGIQRLRPIIGNTAIGISGKYRSYNVGLDGSSVGKASGWGFDVGLLAPLPWGIRLGATVQDVGGSDLGYEGGESEQVYSSRFRVGLAKKPIEGLTMGIDWSGDAFHLGSEYWLRGLLALRAGISTDLDTPETFGDATTKTYGFGIKYRFAQFDYAYESHPLLSPTHYTSLSLAYNPRVVNIKDTTIRPNPIFRSLYPHYQENDFFDVVITNSAPEPIEVSVSLFLPKVMSVPHRESVLLPAQSKEKYTFKVTFDSDLFNSDDAYYDNFVTPVIRVDYQRNRKDQFVEKQLERVYVAGKGKLSWNIKGMAAAYVTPEDMAIAGMARGLVQRYSDLLGAKFNRSNMGKAVVLYNALGAYRIRYQADQKTPFTSVSNDKTIFDTVQYPSELLEKPEGVETKIGDCDDLTVLFVSLLENLSIDTAFLEANDPGKGHIYMMFDSGISPDKAEDHFLSSAEYVVWQGRVWIPIETTMYGFTFSDAWRNGVAEYKRLKPRKLIDELYVQQYLQTYKPATLPPSTVQLPESAVMDSLMERDLAYFDDRVDQIALGASVSLDTPDGAYDAGAAYLRINHLEKASSMFERVLGMRPEHVDALNSLGVVAAYRGEYDEALALFRRSLELEDNTGIRMNIALGYYLKGERETADALYQEVVSLDESYVELFDFLADVGNAQESYDIGVSYLRQDKFDLALAQFEEAIAADDLFADAINAKGVVLTHKGQFDEALELFEQAVQLDPDQSGHRLNVSLIYYLKGDRDRADALYRQIIAEDEAYDGLLDFLAEVESAQEHYRIAAAYITQEQFDRALDRLDKALKADPQMGDAYNAKAVVLSNKGRFDEAYLQLEEAESLMPEHPGVKLNMAILRYLQGRRNEATVIYRQVVESDDRYEGYLNFLDNE
ncbi:MAG: tetratricopeptide repeat protein [Candidatus Latescibacterota bacterium]|nr:tetratricopeptide repeat protein [Candidatus Latescibacterota bacterium]